MPENGPIGCHVIGARSNTGASAKPRAGSVKLAAATMPAECATPVMKRLRETVSPSKAPGMPRSLVSRLVGDLRSDLFSPIYYVASYYTLRRACVDPLLSSVVDGETVRKEGALFCRTAGSPRTGGRGHGI